MIFKEIKIKEQRRRKKISSAQIIQTSPKSFEHTSRNSHQFINYDQHIRKALEKTFMLSDFKKTLKRHIKESIVSAYSLKLTKADLKKIKSYQKIKIARNRLSDTVASKSDVVTIDMIRAMKRKHEEDVVEAAQKTVRIAEAKLKREEKKREKERLKPWKPVFVELRRVVQARRKRLSVKEKDYVVVAVAD